MSRLGVESVKLGKFGSGLGYGRGRYGGKEELRSNRETVRM